MHAGGYYNTHIAGWFQWMRYLSFISYTLSALGKVEYELAAPFQYVTPTHSLSLVFYLPVLSFDALVVNTLSATDHRVAASIGQ